MKTHHLIFFITLLLAQVSCSEADQVSGTYNGTFDVTGNGTYSGYLDISAVNASTIKIQPGSSFGIMTLIENISVSKSGATYDLQNNTSSNVNYFTGYISNNTISCTYNYGGSSVYSFSGTK